MHFYYLMFRQTQIGVVSRGGLGGCAHPKLPGLFARVTSFKKWIQDNTEETQDSLCNIDS